MTVCAPVETPVHLLEVVCPVCKPKMRRVLTRATDGSVVEVYCRHCKYRAVVVVMDKRT